MSGRARNGTATESGTAECIRTLSLERDKVLFILSQKDFVIDMRRKQIMDYNKTINLPKTEFPMRAGLPKREPDMLASWYEMDLYNQIQE